MDIEQVKKEDTSILMPIDELKQELIDLENGSFNFLDDKELREKVVIIHNGLLIKAPILPIGTKIFRAVRVTERPAHKSRISYPPKQEVRSSGRMNRAGEVMFYGAVYQFVSCLQECSCKVGEFFAVSAWLTTHKMMFNHLGYSKSVLHSLQPSREPPWFSDVEQDLERNTLIREWQARVVTKQVSRGEEHFYRLPIALKEFALGQVVQPNSSHDIPDRFSGVIYPSIAMSLLVDNIAILPSEADSKMTLLEVNLVILNDSREIKKENGNIETQRILNVYDVAIDSKDGSLVWGQKSQTMPPNCDKAPQLSP